MDEKTILEKLDAVLKLNENLMDEIKKKDKEIKSLKSDGKKFNVLVGSNSVMGVSLVSPSGDIEADIPFNDTVMLSSSDVESLLKSSTVRSQFMKGLLYFEDESNYEVFSVKRKYNLQREHIKEILNTNNVEKIRAFFNSVKADGTDPSIRHAVFYQIVALDYDGELKDVSFDVRDFVESYFNMNLRNAAHLYSAMKGIMV